MRKLIGLVAVMVGLSAMAEAQYWKVLADTMTTSCTAYCDGQIVITTSIAGMGNWSPIRVKIAPDSTTLFGYTNVLAFSSNTTSNYIGWASDLMYFKAYQGFNWAGDGVGDDYLFSSGADARFEGDVTIAGVLYSSSPYTSHVLGDFEAGGSIAAGDVFYSSNAAGSSVFAGAITAGAITGSSITSAGSIWLRSGGNLYISAGNANIIGDADIYGEIKNTQTGFPVTVNDNLSVTGYANITGKIDADDSVTAGTGTFTASNAYGVLSKNTSSAYNSYSGYLLQNYNGTNFFNAGGMRSRNVYGVVGGELSHIELFNCNGGSLYNGLTLAGYNVGVATSNPQARFEVHAASWTTQTANVIYVSSADSTGIFGVRTNGKLWARGEGSFNTLYTTAGAQIGSTLIFVNDNVTPIARHGTSVASGNGSFVLSRTSTGSATDVVAIGGSNHNLSGQDSVAIGGDNLFSTAFCGTLINGARNTVTQQYATIINGYDNTNSGDRGTQIGCVSSNMEGDGSLHVGGANDCTTKDFTYDFGPIIRDSGTYCMTVGRWWGIEDGVDGAFSFGHNGSPLATTVTDSHSAFFYSDQQAFRVNVGTTVATADWPFKVVYGTNVPFAVDGSGIYLNGTKATTWASGSGGSSEDSKSVVYAGDLYGGGSSSTFFGFGNEMVIPFNSTVTITGLSFGVMTPSSWSVCAFNAMISTTNAAVGTNWHWLSANDIQLDTATLHCTRVDLNETTAFPCLISAHIMYGPPSGTKPTGWYCVVYYKP